MSKNKVIEKLISGIKHEFPDVAVRMEQREREWDLEPDDSMDTELFSCFSSATTDAIKCKNADTVSRHLAYMSRKLEYASGIEKKYIDTYYTESLMWGIKDQKLKSWGWKLFPENIKRLYENMWGKQDL